MRLSTPSNFKRHNQGVALFISLVLLLVLTIIGVSAVQTTSLEVRMARNDQDYLLAFEAAESALRDAEAVVGALTNTGGFVDAGTGGFWTSAPLNQDDRWEDTTVWNGATTVAAGTAVSGVAAQPRYMIEHVATVTRIENASQLDDDYSGTGGSRSIDIFRVTARGSGGSANANVMLQSTVGRILN